MYVIEALRLAPRSTSVLRISDILPGITDWRYTQSIKKGDILLLDIAAASRAPDRFPSPNDIKLDRPEEAYIPFYDGPFAEVVTELVVIGLVAQLRVFAKLKGLRRAPGRQGCLRSRGDGGMISYLNEAQDEWTSLPTSKTFESAEALSFHIANLILGFKVRFDSFEDV